MSHLDQQVRLEGEQFWSDVQGEIDDLFGFDSPENRAAAIEIVASRTKQGAETWAKNLLATNPATRLKGSEKQIAWALKIREKAGVPPEVAEKITSAKFWIDRRHNSGESLTREILSMTGNLTKGRAARAARSAPPTDFGVEIAAKFKVEDCIGIENPGEFKGYAICDAVTDLGRVRGWRMKLTGPSPVIWALKVDSQTLFYQQSTES